MESADLPFKRDEARVQRQRLTGSAIDSSSQSLEPARSGVVNRKVRRDPELGELRRGDRGTRGESGIKDI